MIELNKANIQALKDLYQIKEGIKKEVTIKNATLYVRKSRRAGIWF